MCAIVFLAYLQMMPTNALLDLAAMKLTSRYGGDFGKQRLYGAFGYGVGGYISGMMASAIGIEWCFTMMLGVSCVSSFVLLRYIPAGYGDDNEHRNREGILWSSAQVIIRRPDVLVLFLVALGTGVSGGFIDSYLFLNVYDLSDDGLQTCTSRSGCIQPERRMSALRLQNFATENTNDIARERQIPMELYGPTV
ncbi:hypothetical protein PHYPSEUDO_004674 [Phytophthora pseudosyringae]|uniref:Major facilitator superfamily associated domain-containing protein n=1 Tax=Phytophthora pseudosyringae TaxID=221518 RepID=A0A8T1VRH7_9STRA|nr:hypothetical protein PHYPSEUDO_004674 [Phytophthora pseudosyringae]